MRAKHDIEGNHRSEAPACHRCGLPLLADSEYCPFCERWLTEGTVEKHVRSILSKLNLPEAADDHRRVRAVITFLESR